MAESGVVSPRRGGLPRLLIGIVVRPRQTLMTVKEGQRRSWWLPALLTVLLVVLPIAVAAPISAREAIRSLDEEMPDEVREQFSEEYMQRAYDAASSPFFTAVFPAIGTVIGHGVGWLAWAGILYLGSIMLGGRGTFEQVFPIVGWARFPYALRGLAQTVYILVSGELIKRPGLSGLIQDAPSDVFTGAPDLGRALTTAFLSRVDLFLIWSLVLLVVGVSVTTKLSRRKSVLLTLAGWALITLLVLIPSLAGVFVAQRAFVGA